MPPRLISNQLLCAASIGLTTHCKVIIHILVIMVAGPTPPPSSYTGGAHFAPQRRSRSSHTLYIDDDTISVVLFHLSEYGLSVENQQYLKLQYSPESRHHQLPPRMVTDATPQ
ncbi:hypothetical protein DMENIID0001_044400 [Sergentomyia squamirostris]